MSYLKKLESLLKFEHDLRFEYYTSNRDNTYAEYIESFGYGDYSVSDILERVKEVMSAKFEDIDNELSYLEGMGKPDLFHILSLYCSLSPYKGYEPNDDFIAFIAMGEEEIEISESILNLMDKVADWSDISSDFYLSRTYSGFGYMDLSGYGWSMDLTDKEGLLKYLEEQRKEEEI